MSTTGPGSQAGKETGKSKTEGFISRPSGVR